MLYYLFQHYSQISASSQVVAPSLPEHVLLANRRVAHEDILCFYLECVPGANLSAFEKAKEILESMNDRDALDRRIRSSKPEEWPSIISLLSSFQNQFHPGHAETGLIVLFNLFPDWRKNSPLGTTGTTPMIVGKVVRALLKHLKTPDEIEGIVRRVLPELTSLYSKTELINWVGHQEGGKLISKGAKAEFSKELSNHARSMSSDDLAQEEDLAWILKFIKNSGHPVEIADSPKITFAILRSSLTRITSSDGDLSQGLSWDDVLVELYGSKNILKEQVDILKKQLKDKDFKQWLESQTISVPEAEAIIKLAKKTSRRTAS